MASSTTGSMAIASRYATALFDLADESKALDQVAGDLQTVKSILDESDDLRRVVRSPGLSRADQQRVMDTVLEKAGVSDVTRRFVGVVASNRRLFALPQMIEAYLKELARRRGEVVADVRTALELTPDQTTALEDQLKKSVGRKVSMNITVDRDLLGGMVVRVGSRMIDSSVRTKLSKLQLAMKGIG